MLIDYAKGFGGKYGVQKELQDKVSVKSTVWLLSVIELTGSVNIAQFT